MGEEESGPLSVSKSGSLSNVLVRVQIGKEFLDRRQNEREIKFIRMGDAVRTVSQLKGEPMFNRGP